MLVDSGTGFVVVDLSLSVEVIDKVLENWDHQFFSIQKLRNQNLIEISVLVVVVESFVVVLDLVVGSTEPVVVVEIFVVVSDFVEVSVLVDVGLAVVVCVDSAVVVSSGLYER